jgi:PAS domain S-box-containing protein
MKTSESGEKLLNEDAKPRLAECSGPDIDTPPLHTTAHLQEALLQAQLALAESREKEQLLAGLIESAMDAIISVDERHRIVLFNPKAERMFGLSVADALGQPLEVLLPEAFHQKHAEHIRTFAQTGVSNRYPMGPGCAHGRRANGELFPVEVSISQINVQGRRLFTAILRDVSQRMHDEQALRENEERLALFAATTFEGIVISKHGRILDCNEQFARKLGYTVKELTGRLIEDLIAPEDRERVAENIRLGLESVVEHAMLRKDGRRIIVEAHGKTTPAGVPGGRRFTAVRDITGRKQVEQALRDSQADLSHAQSVARIGNWRLNIQRNELHWSDETYRLHGIPLGAPLTYETFLATLHPDDRAYVDTMWQACLQGEPHDIEHRLVVDSKVKWVRQKAELEFDGQGQLLGGFGTCQDITDLKQAELALMEADRRKDEFLAMLAHELRNPLTPIRNAAHVLGRLDLQEPRVQWAQQIIERQVGHLTRLVDDLLDVSRIVRGKVALKMARIEVAAVVNHALDMARPLIDAMGHRVEVRLPEQAVYLEGDPVRLAQVLLNLLDNAAKYTPAGGKIQLDVSVAGPHIEIRVCDNGMGIPAELLPQVFDLFKQGERTLDRSQGGLGIGLTLVKELVEMHGGLLEALSTGAGQGSTFTIWLPALCDTPLMVNQEAPAASPGAAHCRVLVVDDDDAVADSMSMLLQINGHDVRVAASGQAALEIARSLRPQVVLLDIGLQGMDGYEVARQLRAEQGEAICLIAVTGYGDEEARSRSAAAGFDQQLVKPVPPDIIFELLAEIGLTQTAERPQGDGVCPSSTPAGTTDSINQ